MVEVGMIFLRHVIEAKTASKNLQNEGERASIDDGPYLKADDLVVTVKVAIAKGLGLVLNFIHLAVADVRVLLEEVRIEDKPNSASLVFGPCLNQEHLDHQYASATRRIALCNILEAIVFASHHWVLAHEHEPTVDV